MGTVLNLTDLSGDFRYKILKPLFVYYLMATKVFEIPPSLLARYLEFFDIENDTPMQSWDQDMRSIYENLAAHFQGRSTSTGPQGVSPVTLCHRRGGGRLKGDFRLGDFRVQCESDDHDLRQTYFSGAVNPLFGTLREGTSHPY